MLYEHEVNTIISPVTHFSFGSRDVFSPVIINELIRRYACRRYYAKWVAIPFCDEIYISLAVNTHKCFCEDEPMVPCQRYEDCCMRMDKIRKI
jgi:hypothetical protein